LKNAPEAERIPVLTSKIISNSQINMSAPLMCMDLSKKRGRDNSQRE
jgi:hypothetical protein